MEVDEKYMRRAMQLARLAAGNTTPNPMVGAVIVNPEGQIIGEGYHRVCGSGHAEVNAIASVKDEAALRDATMYVTLEPCSHYGKTPPCAKLIIDKGIPRVIVGCLDPFEKVSGRGVCMLRDAGVEVVVMDGHINEECRDLNRRFMTAHTLQRPFITLKWAQSVDGYMDCDSAEPFRFSTPLSSLLVHRVRSLHDAVLVGIGTVVTDNPRLNVRGWFTQNTPEKIVLCGSRGVPDDARIWGDGKERVIVVDGHRPLGEVLSELYQQGITSILVEGGPTVLKSFISAGLWDEARVETAPVALGKSGRAKAPALPIPPYHTAMIDGNAVSLYRNI